jgi:putative oxidoreductase
MAAFKLFVPALGRLLIAIVFLLSGIGKVPAPAATQTYIASVGRPMPVLAYYGGGYQTRLVATGMTVFCAATAIALHSNFSDQEQMINSLKDVAVAVDFCRWLPSVRAHSVWIPGGRDRWLKSAPGMPSWVSSKDGLG